MKKVFIYTALILFSLFFLLPLFWILLSSFKTDLEYVSKPIVWLPKALQWENYAYVWQILDVFNAFRNSLIISVSTTVLNVYLGALSGYTLAKKQVMFKNPLIFIIIITMMVPPVAMILPNFFIITKIGLYDNLLGLILPFAVNTFGIFFMYNYIQSIPDSLIEAARIDGSGELMIFHRIILPTIKPAIVTLSIISFVNAWNSFTMPLVLLRSENLYTLPLRLSAMIKATDSPIWVYILAATVISIVPIIVIFLLLQRHFVKGVMDGAVKG